jgi:DNA-directed RNA polymerase specialized sigma24 family protein
MSANGSVSLWIEGLRARDEGDIRRLWERYFEQLVRLARARLPVHARRALDEEDVALSAFQSFCDRAGKGLFAKLEDRDDLWRLLSTITARKVIAAIRHESRRKRSGVLAPGESMPQAHDWDDVDLAPFLSREPTPEAAAVFAEEYDRLFAGLVQPILRTIALRKLEGLSSREIGVELGVSTRTVDRKLDLIRMQWEDGSHS